MLLTLLHELFELIGERDEEPVVARCDLADLSGQRQPANGLTLLVWRRRLANRPGRFDVATAAIADFLHDLG